MTGSGCQVIRASAPGPATRVIAAIISPIVSLRPVRFRQRLNPKAAPSSVAAWIRLATTVRGAVCQTAKSRGTGQFAVCPCSVSRKIEDMKLDAAALGLPGRIETVGRRRPRPSRNPRRDMSDKSNSPMAFCVP